MAVAVVAGIAAVGGAAASSFAIAGTLAIGWGAAAASFAIGAGLSVVSRAIAPKPKLNTGASLAGLTATVREPATSKKVVYGRTRIGGTVVYLDTTGTDNKYLHMVIAMAGHEIDAFESVYFNDELVWSGTYRNGWNQFARINFHEGDQTTADSDLVSESTPWTSSHILRDTAYLYVRLQYDADQFPNGIPNISAIVRGKKIYDPRQDSTSSHYDSSVGVSTHRVNDSATWTWSQNPALAVRDYLVDDKYGLGEDAALVNSSALVTAADYCDVDEDSNSDAIPKLEINGIVDTANSRKENIDSMLSSMGGMLVYSGGSYFIRAAQYVSPTITIDESAMVGQIQIQTRQSRRSQYNGVKGVFLSREKNYTVADYPAQISSTYATEDGDPIYLDMALPFVTDNEQAQRLAKVALLKSRQQTVITVPVNLAGLKFKAGDVIQITNERLGYDEKAFEVVDYSIVMEGSGGIRVDLRCIETASSIYDWLSDDAEDFLSGGELTLYDGKTAEPPTSLTATESTRINSDGAVIPTIELAWTAASDAFVDHYEVEWKQSTASTYKTVNTVGTEYEIPVPVVGVTYNTRVRAVNAIGVRSTYATANVTMGGDTTAPAAPTSASTSADVHTLVISWTNPSDLDLSYVEVKRSATSSEGAATVIGRSDGTTFIDGPFTVATTYYYWVRAVDNSGNASSWVSAGSDTTVAVDTADLADDSVTIDKIANTLQSTNYSAGTAGWKLTTDGTFEAGNGTFRGAVTATSGEIGGLTIGSDKIYLGTGTFNNTNTGFYIDDTGQFSLKDKLAFYPSDNTLRVKGNIEADVITVNSNLQVVGDLQASSLAIASITREMFTQDALDEIYGALATAVGGSNGDYQEASSSFTTAGGTVTLALFDHGESDVAVEWLENYGFSQTTDYTGTALQATLTFEASTTSNFATIAASKTETITLGKYDLSSYYGSTYIWYYGPRSVTKTFTTSDLADNTDYYFRVRVTNVGSAFTGQTYPFELEANEGVTGVVSTGGNADTLDNLDSTAFLRSNVDDTFDGNLTVTGNLTVQGTTVSLDVTNLNVEDKNITLAHGAANAAAAVGAGITIDGANRTFTYTAGDKFETNTGIWVYGNDQTSANYSLVGRDSAGNNLLLVRNDGVVQVPSNYFFASHSAGAYFTGAIRARGGISNDGGNNLSISSGGAAITFNSKNFVSVGTISSGAITSTGTSAFGNFRLTDTSKMGFGTVKAGGTVGHTASVDEGIFWHSSADYGVYRTAGVWSGNYQQLRIKWVTGIELDGGSAYGKSGVNIINSDLQVGGTTVIDSARNISAADLTVSGTLSGNFNLSTSQNLTVSGSISGGSLTAFASGTPTITLSDIGSNGSGTASGKIIFTNSDGDAIGIGYTGDSTSDSDLIISTNAGGTYGGYLGLDSAAIADSQADIILEPKGNVRIASNSADPTLTFTTTSNTADPVIQMNGQAGISAEGFEIWYDNSVGDVHLHTTYNNSAAAIRFHTRTGASKATSNERFTITGDGDIQVSGTTVIDASRNLTNIGTATFGPNSTWGKYLKIGGNANHSDANTASIGTTNGNLHIDAATSFTTYLNYYDGTGGVGFGSGSTSVVAWMGPDGDLWKGSADNTGSKYWHAGNDGSGSGLDADTVDGLQAASFLRKDTAQSVAYTNITRWYSNTNAATTSGGQASLEVFAPSPNTDAFMTFHVSSDYAAYFGLDGTTNDLFWGGWSRGAAKYKIWHASNDGSGSGLDADLLDGVQSSSFLRSDTDDSWSGNIETTGTNRIRFGNAYQMDGNDGTIAAARFGTGLNIVGTQTTTGTGRQVRVWGSLITDGGNAYWHSANDGSGSGLDADTVDGIQGASLLRSDYQDTFTGNYLAWPTLSLSISNNNASNNYNTYFRGSSTHFVLGLTNGNTFYCNYGNTSGSFRAYGGNFMWNDASVGSPWGTSNDGSGSGLDADLLDGVQATSFMRKDTNQTLSATITFNGDIVGDGSGNRDHGVYGNYNSYKIHHMWGMGTAYRIDPNGANFGNLYGFAYTFSNRVYTSNAMAGSHQIVWCQAGVPKCALGTNIWTAGNVTAYSDRAVKTNLEVIPEALDKVCQINGYTYDRTDFKPDPKTGEMPNTRQAGVVAQEVEKVLPEVVSGEEGGKAVAYGNMVGLLIEAIKELKAEVDDLKAQLEEVK